jgi:type III secretion protein N (ATPase)
MIGRAGGTIVAVDQHRVLAVLHGARAGDRAVIDAAGGERVPALVVGAAGGRTILAPHGDIAGVAAGDRVSLAACAVPLPLGTALLGRAVAGDGAPLDGRPALRPQAGAAAGPGEFVTPNERAAVCEPFWTGIRAIDGPLTIGRGARIGIFGAPGAGKSTLLETIVAASSADAVVVGLIGERGREAERWMRVIGPTTTIVCATGDRSAGERFRAAELAFAQAAALRKRGLHVLLVLDSLARIAAAARDLAVAAGEPVGRGGYPPSVVARQARLLERAGATAAGSVTLIATVLSEGALENDPVADAARAALDGHVILSPRLAAAGWFPAIDLPASASRTLADVASPDHRAAAARLRAAIAALAEARDARSVGLDPAAGDPALARAIAAEGRIEAFLRQGAGPADPAETLMLLAEIADGL